MKKTWAQVAPNVFENMEVIGIFILQISSIEDDEYHEDNKDRSGAPFLRASCSKLRGIKPKEIE
ncbi:MAG: hypothetical protein DIZ77_05445 [endosymbiont of Seepiophila jonesi]|uniref:Uncharacterized protein n=1 Tax=endosymbiont of Lamellibrachia luymesi TaxID=2200907 RepID=A0A370DUE7_9GAMM|nr:MAG: hypothetical protein DIZ79_13840 [endosymbiont of Lamellibrachia luymesi]RDH93641.1 MAG: hypothetical protein DIZ77_05445 [endosymbiont of Seepiophila jonesi]